MLKKYSVILDMVWPKFELALPRELGTNSDSISFICSLHAYSRTHDITLPCFELTGRPCHRHLLKRIIEEPPLLEPGAFDRR